MRNVVLSILLLMCNTGILLAQHSITLSGRVIDKETKEALPFSTVRIQSPSTAKLIAGTTTGENGRFSFTEIKKGEYNVEISYIGYNEKIIPLYIGGELNKSYDLGTVELIPGSTNIGEVTVNGVRSKTSASLDKKVFSIYDNISQSGGSVLEAMRNLPGLTVDQDGKVYLRGSDKVTVLIDGKQSSLTGFGNQKGLDNLSANNIERIEIINNPSAKYDSKGMAGIINIIYKENKDKGLNGDIAFNFGLGELSKRKDNLPDIMEKYSCTPKYNPSVSLNYRTDKANFFIQSEGMFRKKVNSNEFSNRNYSGDRKDEVSQFLENRTQQLYNIKGGVDIFFNKNNTLTLYGLFEDEYHIDRGHVPYDYTDGTRKRLWKWAEDERTFHMNYNANYKHLFAQAGHYIELTGHYSNGNEDELFPFTDTKDNLNSTDSTHLINKEEIISFNVDYVKPLRMGRIELGAKSQLRNIPISYRILPGNPSILDNNLGDWSKYNEDIYSGYLNYLLESKLIDIEAGLRVEQTSVKYKIDERNNYYKSNDSYSKFDLFPNVRFTIKMNELNKLSLFYNRRVDRPGEFDLRPFPKYDDPEILKTGNPYLRPQYTQSFEAAYKTIWNSGSFFISGYYKHIDDIFTRIYVSDKNDQNLIHSITQNLNNGYNWGTEAVFEQSFGNAFNCNASFNWYRNVINAFEGSVIYPQSQDYTFAKKTSNTWNMKVNGTLKLKDNFAFQASFIYYAPDIIPQGEVKSRSSLDLGISKKALNNKLEFTLAATDLLNDFGLRQTINGQDFTMSRENYYETQVITIGAKYHF